LTDSTVMTERPVDLDALTAWTAGRLVFTDAPVPEVLTTVGRWYGYDLRLSDTTLRQQHLSVSFDRSSLADAFELLATTLNVSLTIDGHVVTLKPRRRAS